MIEKYHEESDRFVSRSEYDREILLINTSLKALHEHFITSNVALTRSNMLHDATNEKLNELKTIMIGENSSSLRNRVDFLEKRDLTKRSEMRFLILTLTGVLTFLVSFEPITKVITHILKYNG